MVSTQSTMLPLGTKLPEFNLADADGQVFTSGDLLEGKGLLVAFWCNHCPYVKHLKTAFSTLARQVSKRGLGVVAINANDATQYSDDGVAGMKQDIETYDYVFPYLVDQSQAVARSFGAVCTPEFYLFDGDGLLQYRGRFDASTPRNDQDITADDITRAIDAVVAGKPVAGAQYPSVGCSIKWTR